MAVAEVASCWVTVAAQVPGRSRVPIAGPVAVGPLTLSEGS